MTNTDTNFLSRGVALELPVGRWIPITKAYVAFDGPFPIAVSFDDEEIRQASSWRDVYGQVGAWLAMSGRLPEAVSYPANNKLNMVALGARHPDGSEFERPYRLPNGLWLDVSGEERFQRDLAVVLLRERDVDPSTVMVMLAHH